MCIICETQNMDDLIHLTELNCAHCPIITTIPGTLVNLTELYCYYCPLITTIPGTVVNLK